MLIFEFNNALFPSLLSLLSSPLLKAGKLWDIPRDTPSQQVPYYTMVWDQGGGVPLPLGDFAYIEPFTAVKGFLVLRVQDGFFHALLSTSWWEG